MTGTHSPLEDVLDSLVLRALGEGRIDQRAVGVVQRVAAGAVLGCR